MKNYAEEEIPDFLELTAELSKRAEDILHENKYHFHELFIFNEKGKYYEKNNALFSKIGFNTSLKKNGPINEIKGLYIFYEDDTPVYVGISRKLIRRLRNHFLGKSHFEASLVYLMARHEYDQKYGLYIGERKDFPFEEYRKRLQQKMLNDWKIEVIPELDNYKLYYLEIILACKLKTYWNSFETH